MEPRLKSGIWVKALVRQLDLELMTVMVLRSGDPDGGAIYLKVNRFAEGCIVFNRSYGQHGERLWSPATGEAPVKEARADEYLARQINYDPDCWIVEIEDMSGKFSVKELVA